MRSLQSHHQNENVWDSRLCCWLNVHYLGMVDWFNNKEKKIWMRMWGWTILSTSSFLPSLNKGSCPTASSGKKHQATAKAKNAFQKMQSAKTHIHTDHPKTTLRLGKALHLNNNCVRTRDGCRQKPEPTSRVCQAEGEGKPHRKRRQEWDLTALMSVTIGCTLLGPECEPTPCCSTANWSDVCGNFDLLKSFKRFHYEAGSWSAEKAVVHLESNGTLGSLPLKNIVIELGMAGLGNSSSFLTRWDKNKELPGPTPSGYALSGWL